MEKKFQKQPGYSYVKQYQVRNKLGAGGTAKVKLGFDCVNQQFVALKIFQDPKTSKCKIKIPLHEVKKEFEIIQGIQHKNIVNLIEILEEVQYEKKSGGSYLCTVIVLELSSGGELFDFMKHTQEFKEPIARYYFQQLIETLEFLNQKDICHRDLKLENLLFDYEFQLKIADFGFARNIQGNRGDGVLRSQLGTEGYQAPEIYQRYYTGEKVDVFACGVLLFLFLSGRPPFENSKQDNKLYSTLQKRKQKFWQFQVKYTPFQEDAIELMDRMLRVDPNERPTFEEVKTFAWYKGEIATRSQLMSELSRREKVVKTKVKEEKEEEKRQKMKDQQTGFRGYRSAEINDEIKEQLVKVENIYEKQLVQGNRVLKTGVANKLDIVSGFNVDVVLKRVLVTLLQICTDHPVISETSYKINCYKVDSNQQQLRFTVYLLDLENDEIKIHLVKNEGPSDMFQDVIQKIQEDFNVVDKKEEKKDEKQEESENTQN